jgi:hypothetical protein
VSRIDRDFPKGDEVPVEAAELIEEIEAERSRTEAVVRYFSVGDGWEEASVQLKGAFAAPELKK